VKNTTDILKKRLKGLGNGMGKASVLAAGIAVRERSWGTPQDVVKNCTNFFCAFISHWDNVAHFATLNFESYGNVENWR